MSVILNVASVRAFIAGLAGLPPWDALAACVVISVKTQFSDQVKVKSTKAYLKFSKNCLNILMGQQFQDFS